MTSIPQHLRNAPIVEAMIAFDFVAQRDDSAALLAEFYSIIKAEYPVRNELQEAELTFNEQGSSGTTRPVGARFATEDGKRTCVLNKSSFICSRLHPYETWESLKGEFARLWELYSSLSEIAVTKVAVRYINKIHVPEGKDVSLYLKTYPELAEGLPQSTASIWLRLELVIPDPRGLFIVTEAQLPFEKPGYVSIALDHDLQFLVTPETNDIWSLLDRARELKNQYFFASISPELLTEYL